ncbi:AtzE family amidohydrolase [Pseudorhodoplanes sp.]|uniref:AtzE family amidohydrolase n=1 Tax=Pseudorhodoplanes sp. TaxID=1934341 RepID=UPI003D0A5246
MNYSDENALAIAAAVRGREISAAKVVEAALGVIGMRDPSINAFTDVLAERARREAAQLDRDLAEGREAGPLAGVPFAVKNLFDVEGLRTLAGAKINRDHAPAGTDAAVVRSLSKAGAILVGTLNMDEYAYGYTTENTHFGPTRNPYDLQRSAGGSSGGSGAAVAAGMVPLSLGTDTGGSVRVPASFCGLFGVKPTFGRISRRGTVLFAPSVDHVGAMARTTADLAAMYDAIEGPDPSDEFCSTRDPDPVLPELDQGIGGLRIAIADAYFLEHIERETHDAVMSISDALGVRERVCLPHVDAGRSCATVITAVEGASQHLESLRRRPQDFDPMTRDRFLAGALLPGSVYQRAQASRRFYRDAVREVFQRTDVLIAPCTPAAAPLIGQDVIEIGGNTFPSRGHVGRCVIPFSIIGLPVISVPARVPGLPRGVQLVAAPYMERHIFRVAAHLERIGAAGFVAPPDQPAADVARRVAV